VRYVGCQFRHIRLPDTDVTEEMLACRYVNAFVVRWRVPNFITQKIPTFEQGR
jgi:hypothetical protein